MSVGRSTAGSIPAEDLPHLLSLELYPDSGFETSNKDLCSDGNENDIGQVSPLPSVLD